MRKISNQLYLIVLALIVLPCCSAEFEIREFSKFLPVANRWISPLVSTIAVTTVKLEEVQPVEIEEIEVADIEGTRSINPGLVVPAPGLSNVYLIPLGEPMKLWGWTMLTVHFRSEATGTLDARSFVFGRLPGDIDQNGFVDLQGDIDAMAMLIDSGVFIVEAMNNDFSGESANSSGIINTLFLPLDLLRFREQMDGTGIFANAPSVGRSLPQLEFDLLGDDRYWKDDFLKIHVTVNLRESCQCMPITSF